MLSPRLGPPTGLTVDIGAVWSGRTRTATAACDDRWGVGVHACGAGGIVRELVLAAARAQLADTGYSITNSRTQIPATNRVMPSPAIRAVADAVLAGGTPADKSDRERGAVRWRRPR